MPVSMIAIDDDPSTWRHGLFGIARARIPRARAVVVRKRPIGMLFAHPALAVTPGAIRIHV
jgi:hypothetical protein